MRGRLESCATKNERPGQVELMGDGKRLQRVPGARIYERSSV